MDTRLYNMAFITGDVTSGHAGWSGGYLFGYTNRHFEITQEFIVDNFELSLTKPSVLP